MTADLHVVKHQNEADGDDGDGDQEEAALDGGDALPGVVLGEELAARLPADSHVVLSHAEAGDPQMEAAAQVYRRMVGPVVLRSAEELDVLLKGWDFGGPGGLPAVNWWPQNAPPPLRSPLPMVGAVAAVPA